MPALLFTAADLANYLYVSVKTLARWRITGSGPHFKKVGKAVVYAQADVDAWLMQQTRRSTSDPGPAVTLPLSTVHALRRH